ncbi:MAG: RdgB/HAM1 family non-canonical purine NTP pyrophosphatase [Rhodothermales bacterium]|nr:RdgB/HAM1 family non-canonical purine NTP pyrophosphatase [Rhodothermales bacterium]MBO6778496.1 RdgB/HAM1 family non-canonical purine NTP pyrophosphatase [Rhodothermales bacterium]
MNQLVVATGNPGKLAEFRQLLLGRVEHILSSADVAAPEVVEDQPTLEGNALKKARTLHRFTGLPALADDTGLEVTSLDGRPGVYSARYAGPDCSPQDNIRKLLGELEHASDRSARFRTAIALVSDQGETVVEGICAGTILRSPLGEGGFGYDPIFQPDGETLTFAQLPAERKNVISHRGRALQALLEAIPW